ncbi:MAG: transposase [Rhodovulum sp.]
MSRHPDRRTRRRFTPQQKANVVRRHLADKVAVSDLADELDIQPSLIHTWIQQLLTQAERAFEQTGTGRRTQDQPQQKITQLQQKLTQKNEVIAELMQEHVQLKKELGEP